MDAFVVPITVALIGMVGVWCATFGAYLRSESKGERLKWTLDRTEGERDQLLRKLGILATLVKDLERQNAQLLAARSQPISQEMQHDAPEVVRVLPVAASRLAEYVKQQAAATGQTLSDYEAEQMAASMLVESGI